jgi:hypothetical protein
VADVVSTSQAERDSAMSRRISLALPFASVCTPSGRPVQVSIEQAAHGAEHLAGDRPGLRSR